MARYFFAFLLLSLQTVHAADCSRNIPGHYIDRFTNNDNGTTKDEMTGLTWMRCDIDTTWNLVTKKCDGNENEQQQIVRQKYIWQDALLEVTKANSFAKLGFNDWRLPNIKEIASLEDLSCVPATGSYDFAIDNDVFLLPSASYWSSTPARLKLGTSLKTNTVDTFGNPIIQAPRAWKMTFKIGKLGAATEEITLRNAVRLVRGTSSK